MWGNNSSYAFRLKLNPKNSRITSRIILLKIPPLDNPKENLIKIVINKATIQQKTLNLNQNPT